jgi:hypothetical protein
MNKLFHFSLTLLLLAAACTSLLPTDSTFDTAKTSGTTTMPVSSSTLPSQATVRATPSTSFAEATLEPTASPPFEQRASVLEVIEVCPEQREVPFTELGLDSSDRLVVMLIDESGTSVKPGLFMISGEDPTPRLIPNTIAVDDWLYGNYFISPDGHWFRFARWKEGDSLRTGEMPVELPQSISNPLQNRSILRTDLNGTIDLTTDGSKLWIEVERVID